MGSNVKPKAIDWLWPDWLARGKLHVLAGRPGALKTTAALGFAAAITRGGQWPDGSPAERGIAFAALEREEGRRHAPIGP